VHYPQQKEKMEKQDQWELSHATEHAQGVDKYVPMNPDYLQGS
jgi:hypothetical protein